MGMPEDDPQPPVGVNYSVLPYFKDDTCSACGSPLGKFILSEDYYDIDAEPTVDSG